MTPDLVLLDVVTLWAVNIARKPADRDHPYGQLMSLA